ncbi:2'-5' RNA ligase family protein [Streptomyces botrytidirepellens]|uniref:2'-5' RNA ligase family protein n=1 Tax=Streptomyces botrytidirepellens TaxID=2486417 RepID=UPI001610128B|nr:2'-5' RNA ligase family protein [Streptomyces botrytidirepellens]
MYITVELAQHPEVAELVRGAWDVLRGFPLSHVQDPWLHITLDQITDEPTSRITQYERDTLTAELTEALGDAEPFDITVGSLLSSRYGVIADLHPDEELTSLHRRVRGAIRAVRGERAVQYPWGVQHLTISYAQAEADSDEAQRLLRSVRPGHACLHIDKVRLVDVTADSGAKTITWQTLAEIPLGR